MDYLTYKAYIASKIEDNTTGEISAQDMRECFYTAYDAMTVAASGITYPIPSNNIEHLQDYYDAMLKVMSDITDLKIVDEHLNIAVDLNTVAVAALPDFTTFALKTEINEPTTKVTAVVSDPNGLATRAECITAMVDNAMDWTVDSEFFITETAGDSICLVHYHALGAINEPTAGKFFVFPGKLAV